MSNFFFLAAAVRKGFSVQTFIPVGALYRSVALFFRVSFLEMVVLFAIDFGCP